MSQRNALAADGFVLAMHLIDSLYPNNDIDGKLILNRLRELARGEVSIFNSPEEELQEAESRRGKPMSEMDRAAFIREFDNRRDIERSSRETAQAIVLGLHE